MFFLPFDKKGFAFGKSFFAVTALFYYPGWLPGSSIGKKSCFFALNAETVILNTATVSAILLSKQKSFPVWCLMRRESPCFFSVSSCTKEATPLPVMLAKAYPYLQGSPASIKRCLQSISNATSPFFCSAVIFRPDLALWKYKVNRSLSYW